MTQAGKVEWIGLRTDHNDPMKVVDQATIDEQNGLEQDRFQGGTSHRQVTLFELEFLDTIAGFLGVDRVGPEQTRRNVGVRGLNLHALIGHEVTIGDCVLKITDDCAPCKRMETTVGVGAQNAMVGLAGVTASVVNGGKIRVGDEIKTKA